MLKSKDLEELSIFFAGMSVMALFVGVVVNELFLFVFLLFAILAVWLDDLGVKRWLSTPFSKENHRSSALINEHSQNTYQAIAAGTLARLHRLLTPLAYRPSRTSVD